MELRMFIILVNIQLLFDVSRYSVFDKNVTGIILNFGMQFMKISSAYNVL